MAIEKNIETWRNPYGNGFSITRLKNITIKSGLTVLVGCNGAGKTTLIKNIAEQLKKENIPYYVFDNLSFGDKKSVSKMMYNNNIEKAALILSSSEGENIYSVNEGFHSFKFLQDAEKFSTYYNRFTNFLIVECIIPKGSFYYEGFIADSSNYCSDTIILNKVVYSNKDFGSVYYH